MRQDGCDKAGSSAAANEASTSGALEAVRLDLSARLPALLENAVAGYRRFTEADPPEDAKAFAAHQTACRTALAHIHLLIKLAGWAESVHQDDSALDADDDLHRLVSEAEAALRAHGMEDD